MQMQTSTAPLLPPALPETAAPELLWYFGFYSQHVQSQLGCLRIQVMVNQLPSNWF